MEECDNFLNEKCVDGTCPILVEEALYGSRGKCDDYCGSGFTSCNFCYFRGNPDFCNPCIHKGGKEKS